MTFIAEEMARLENSDKDAVVEEPRKTPGASENAAETLWSLGIRSVEDLKSRDAIAMYEELRNQKGSYCKPCMLDILRIAIEYASSEK